MLEHHARLSGKGYQFISQTDTELLAHLVEARLDLSGWFWMGDDGWTLRRPGSVIWFAHVCSMLSFSGLSLGGHLFTYPSFSRMQCLIECTQKTIFNIL